MDTVMTNILPQAIILPQFAPTMQTEDETIHAPTMRAEELEVRQRTKQAMQIFQETRDQLDLELEATVYDFPVCLQGLSFNWPRPGEILKSRLKFSAGSKNKPMLVKVQGKESLGVCLALPHSFDQKSCSAAVIPMSNPNQAPVRVRIEELRQVC